MKAQVSTTIIVALASILFIYWYYAATPQSILWTAFVYLVLFLCFLTRLVFVFFKKKVDFSANENRKTKLITTLVPILVLFVVVAIHFSIISYMGNRLFLTIINESGRSLDGVQLFLRDENVDLGPVNFGEHKKLSIDQFENRDFEVLVLAQEDQQSNQVFYHSYKRFIPIRDTLRIDSNLRLKEFWHSSPINLHHPR